LEKKYFLIAAIIMVFASWNSVGFHQGDEHFQVWEFAGYKLGIIPVEDLAWEFGEQMRPAAQPALAYAGYQVFSLGKTIDPFWITFIFRVLSSAFFLVVTWLLWRRFAPALRAQKLKHWLLLVLLFHWCTLYSGVRFSSENWSGLLLAVAFLLYPLPQADEKHRFTPGGGKTTHWYNYILAGGLFGLAFLFRYQVALMVVGFGAWLIFIGKEHFTRLVLLVLGGCAAVALGTVLDYWLYGEWVLAPWNYLAVNLIEGKAATFGSEPWWWYFIGVLEKGVPPLSLIYLGAGLWFFYRYRKDPITWMAIPFLLVHFYLSRKDVRFLYPLLPYLGLMIMAAVQAIQDTRGSDWFGRRWVRNCIGLLVVINLFLLAFNAIRPNRSQVVAARFIYHEYPEAITLFSDGHQPFNYGELNLGFYQRPGNTIVEKTEQKDWPDCQTNTCLYGIRTRKPNPPAGAQLVYTNRPSWIGIAERNGWLDNFNFWYIYDLKDSRARDN
jgi:phosphatidylinositol glycan class B